MKAGATLIRSGLFGAALLVAIAIAEPADAEVTFTDIAASSGLQFSTEYGPAFDLSEFPPGVEFGLEIVQRNMGNGATIGDYDNDGDLDVYLLGGLGHPNVLYQNRIDTGELQFVDVNSAAGVGNLGLSRIAQFVDLDNDGWRDLVLANDSDATGVHPPSAIYRNEGDGSFTDVTDGSGFTPIGFIKGGLGVVDYDQDGWLDVYVANWGALQAEGFTYLPGHNRLYRNLGNFQFEDVTESVGLGLVESNSFTPLFADFDNDGDSDLYVAVDAYADMFYRNDQGVFVEVSGEVGTVHVGTDMGASVCDFDHDGDLDFFTTNVTHPDGLWGGNTLMVNQLAQTGELSFVDQASSRGVFNTGWGWGTEWIDVNNGGFAKLFAVNGFDEFIAESQPVDVAEGLTDLRCFLFADFGSGNFVELQGTGADIVGDSRAAIAFDADRDGLQELLVTHMDAPINLLHNQTAPTGHWITVKLIGGGPVNRDAIGARVVITVGEQTLVQEMIGGGSYLAGRPYELHFGLGPFTIIDELRVLWPGGYENVAYDVAVDQVFVGQLSIDGDLNGDLFVNVTDLLQVLGAWGPCGGQGPCSEDFDDNGVVDVQDLLLVLANWT